MCGPFHSWLMSAAAGMVLTAIGRSLMSLGYEEADQGGKA
jgi:hypothetical protein